MNIQISLMLSSMIPFLCLKDIAQFDGDLFGPTNTGQLLVSGVVGTVVSSVVVITGGLQHTR